MINKNSGFTIVMIIIIELQWLNNGKSRLTSFSIRAVLLSCTYNLIALRTFYFSRLLCEKFFTKKSFKSTLFFFQKYDKYGFTSRFTQVHYTIWYKPKFSQYLVCIANTTFFWFYVRAKYLSKSQYLFLFCDATIHFQSRSQDYCINVAVLSWMNQSQTLFERFYVQADCTSCHSTACFKTKFCTLAFQ